MTTQRKAAEPKSAAKKNGRPKLHPHCRKPKHPKGKKGVEGYCDCGRPDTITPEILKQLELYLMAGLSDEMAAFMAGISERTLYNYQKKNPDFVQRKARLKNSSEAKARITLYANLHKLPAALWFLERKVPTEFSPKHLHKHSGKVAFDFSEEAAARRKKYVK